MTLKSSEFESETSSELASIGSAMTSVVLNLGLEAVSFFCLKPIFGGGELLDFFYFVFRPIIFKMLSAESI